VNEDLARAALSAVDPEPWWLGGLVRVPDGLAGSDGLTGTDGVRSRVETLALPDGRHPYLHLVGRRIDAQALVLVSRASSTWSNSSQGDGLRRVKVEEVSALVVSLDEEAVLVSGSGTTKPEGLLVWALERALGKSCSAELDRGNLLGRLWIRSMVEGRDLVDSDPLVALASALGASEEDLSRGEDWAGEALVARVAGLSDEAVVAAMAWPEDEPLEWLGARMALALASSQLPHTAELLGHLAARDASLAERTGALLELRRWS
jgi:hypothetical protein